MDKELIYKKIDNLIEQRKILWTAFVVLTGGILGLFFNAISPFRLDIILILKLFVAATGVFFDYILISSIADNRKEIDNLFNKIEKGDLS